MNTSKLMYIRADYELDIINAQTAVINYLIGLAPLRDGQYLYLMGRLNNIEKLKDKCHEQRKKDAEKNPS